MRALFDEDTTPLIRTDFTDDAAWEKVVAAAIAEADFGDDKDDGGGYAPNIRVLADRSLAVLGIRSSDPHDLLMHRSDDSSTVRNHGYPCGPRMGHRSIAFSDLCALSLGA